LGEAIVPCAPPWLRLTLDTDLAPNNFNAPPPPPRCWIIVSFSVLSWPWEDALVIRRVSAAASAICACICSVRCSWLLGGTPARRHPWPSTPLPGVASRFVMGVPGCLVQRWEHPSSSAAADRRRRYSSSSTRYIGTLLLQRRQLLRCHGDRRLDDRTAAIAAARPERRSRAANCCCCWRRRHGSRC